SELNRFFFSQAFNLRIFLFKNCVIFLLLSAAKRAAKVRFLFSNFQIFFQDLFSQLIQPLFETTAPFKDLLFSLPLFRSGVQR
ncbi:hypothetical protein, partial [Taibaiella soli]